MHVARNCLTDKQLKRGGSQQLMVVDLHRMALRPLAMWISLDGHLDLQEILQQTTRDPSVPLKKSAGLLVLV